MSPETSFSKALDEHDSLIGVVICKLEQHKNTQLRGYIAMLVVLETYRGKGVATRLVKMAIEAMIAKDADEVCNNESAFFHPLTHLDLP